MALIVTPLQPTFVAEISGVDLERALDSAVATQIIAAMDQYAVCVYRPGKPLSNEAHIALGKMLGPIDTAPVFKIAGRGKSRLPPELVNAYFEPAHGDRRRLIRDLRESVSFTFANLIEAMS